jgi:hypothetical protein
MTRPGLRARRSDLLLLRALGKPALAMAPAVGAYSLALRPWHLRCGATNAEVARQVPAQVLELGKEAAVTEVASARKK